MKIQIAAILVFCVPVCAQAADSSLTRFAQKWASVLVRSKSSILSSQQKNQPENEPRSKHQNEPQTERPLNEPTDPQVKQQVNAIQTRIDREQKKLEAQMQQLGKQREAALSKHDAKQLKQIELLEQRAIKAYETRIQQIINSAKIQGPAPPNSDLRPGNPTQQAIQASQKVSPNKEVKQNQSNPKKQKRFRLFPFNGG